MGGVCRSYCACKVDIGGGAWWYLEVYGAVSLIKQD